MERRTCEGPMEWEYHDRGPMDATSPFSHFAQKATSRNGFGSAAKPAAQKQNLFANSPSKPLPALPQKTTFAPRVQQGNAAPPFRNPAFTTPRKPFDETIFSEAESSPALTEASDVPNDTPDADRFGDANMGTITPSRVDKGIRYGKMGMTKRHAPGKGAISRGNRDHATLRKRKRHNTDRDVGSVRYHSSRDDSGSDSESDDDDGGPALRSKGPRRKRNGVKGWFDTIVHMINQNPNMPDNLSKWIALLLNIFVISTFVYCGWSLVSTVRTDIRTANEAARLEIVKRSLECNNQYLLNECQKKDRPALKALCDEWDDCRLQDPESIMVVKNTAKQIAEVLNEFTGTMTIHAWAFFFGLFALCVAMNALNAFPAGSAGKAANPIMSTHTNEGGPPQPSNFPGEAPQAFMWVPIQTPQHKRQLDFDLGATDTDEGVSPSKGRAIMPPPQTPSRRQSPSKGDRGRSPVKFGRTTSKFI